VTSPPPDDAPADAPADALADEAAALLDGALAAVRDDRMDEAADLAARAGAATDVLVALGAAPDAARLTRLARLHKALGVALAQQKADVSGRLSRLRLGGPALEAYRRTLR
jgi:hypothetical protein